MTALEWDNRIYTNIKQAINNVCKNVVRQERSTYQKFPTVLLQQMNSPQIALDFGNNDNGSQVSYKFQTFTDGTGKQETAKTIMVTADEEFRRMGFHRTEFRQVNLTNEELFSYLAYYERPVMSGEEITKRP